MLGNDVRFQVTLSHCEHYHIIRQCLMKELRLVTLLHTLEVREILHLALMVQCNIPLLVRKTVNAISSVSMSMLPNSCYLKSSHKMQGMHILLNLPTAKVLAYTMLKNA